MFGRKILATVSLILTAAVLLLAGCATKNEPALSVENETDAVDATVTATEIQQTQTDVEINQENTTLTEVDEETSAVEEEASAAEESSAEAVPQTVEEIVAYFNESANRIKKEAKTVTKNWEKRTVNNDKTDIPAALESFAETTLPKLMGDDTDPIVWSTREDIRNEFIVPQQDYVSVLKAENVVSATCKDSGGYYEIHIKLKDTKNPTAGVGVGAVCDVIETAEVAEKADFIEEFSTQYYNCEVRVKVDKESGRVVHANYKTPLVLVLRVNLFGTHSGTIGFTFEKDYSIVY